MAGLDNRMDRARLRGFERLSVPTLELLHGRPGLRSAIHATVGKVNANWIEASTRMLWQVEGFEHVAELHAPRGLILVSNHRSFFDMYLLSTLLNQRTKLLRRVCYPVRSEFFYTHPIGLLINVSVSGGSMWPPVFRDKERRPLNRVAFDQIAETLVEGTVIGLHPEGKRNKGDDPYSFLPLKPGLGHLVRACDDATLVLPCFIAGLDNSFFGTITRGWMPGVRERGEAIRMYIGAPIPVGALKGEEPGGADAQAITERVFDVVRSLAEQDRAARG